MAAITIGMASVLAGAASIMTKHVLALPPECLPVSYRDVFLGNCRPRQRRWIKPLALQATGLTAEGLTVLGLGYAALAVTGLRDTSLPGPMFVAVGYVSLLVLQGAVLQPPGGAKTWLALRTLASAFTCVAVAASQPLP